jgi:hypothetical protein
MCLRGSWIARTQYLVDANILLAYQMKSRKDLVDFIRAQQNDFYFTETTRDEFKASTRISPSPDKRFTFVESNITGPKKAETLKTFYNLWDKHSEQQKIKGQKPVVSTKQLKSLERNLLAVIEAKGIRANMVFLTNNRAFYNKAIHHEDARQTFERSLHLTGIDSPTRVLFLDDVLERWEKVPE